MQRSDIRNTHCLEGEESPFVVTVSSNVGNLSTFSCFDKVKRFGLQKLTIDSGNEPLMEHLCLWLTLNVGQGL